MAIRIEREKIKNRIRELGYTYTGVAKRAQISPHTLHQMLNNPDYGSPRPYTRKRLAQVLEGVEEEFFRVVGATADKAS